MTFKDENFVVIVVVVGRGNMKQKGKLPPWYNNLARYNNHQFRRLSEKQIVS